MNKLFKKNNVNYFVIVIFKLFILCFFCTKTEGAAKKYVDESISLIRSHESLLRASFFSRRIVYNLTLLTDTKDIHMHMTSSIARNLGAVPWPYTVKNAEDFVVKNKALSDRGFCYNYVLRLIDTGDFIGVSSLHTATYEGSEKPGQIGYWIAERYQGKGYGAEVAAEMILLAQRIGLQYVWASAVADNVPSIKILQKLGMILKTRRLGIYGGREHEEEVYGKVLK